MYLQPGIYRHFKGGLYTVVSMGKDCSSREEVVAYTDADGELNTRPASGPDGWFTPVYDRELPSGEVYSGERFVKVEKIPRF